MSAETRTYIDSNGEPKTDRRNAYESELGELQYDAKNLITLAKAKYNREDVTVSDALDLATRKNDNLEALRKAIAVEIKGEFGMAETVTSTMSTTSTPDLSPEQSYLNTFKARFDSLPQLHPGVEWSDVEKSLQADPEAMCKLKTLDEKGFEMNVFRSKNSDEIQFRTAQTDVTKIAAEYRTIMYDKKAQTDYLLYKANGNAKDIAASLGVEIADAELYEQFRVKNGWVWLATDAATRKAGRAFYGNYRGVFKHNAYYHHDDGSFCAALRVKKA